MFISFMQNDDWVYYKIIQGFLSGNFSLDPITAPTFYTQGLLAFIFSKVFGISNLPILTIIISLSSYFLFVLILNKFYLTPKSSNINLFTSFLFGLLLLFNPWFLYSSIGFMTENYFLFFLLINIYLFNKLESASKEKELKYFVLLFLSIFISFLLRQVVMVFPIAMFLYFLFKKKYKYSLLSIGFFILIYTFYIFVFPKTVEMYEKPLQYHHLLDFEYSFSLAYASLIVISALLLPLLLAFISNNISVKKNISISKLLNVIKSFISIRLLVFFGLSTVFYFALNAFFKPNTVSWGEFPYLENIWERTGLYPRGVLGTKYQFKWNYDLYYYWDLFSKILLSGVLSYTIAFFKKDKFKEKLLDFNFIFILLYFGLMLLTETFYDRYLLILVPFVVLFFLRNIKVNVFNIFYTSLFILFLGFYSYQLLMDFVLVNKYIWDKSSEISSANSLDKKYIQGTNAWKLNYKNTDRYYMYDFSYDSPKVNVNYKNNYELVETKNINYPLNIFIEPKIFLYKRK